MSLFQYFQGSGKTQVSKPSKLCESIKNNLPENINGKELDSIQESLTLTAGAKNKKRVVYEEKQTRYREIRSSLWSCSSYQKVQTKISKLD